MADDTMTQQNEDIIQEIYELEGLISECIRDAHTLASHIARGIAGREVSLAITKLQEAKMWLDQAIVERIPTQPTTGQQEKGTK